MTRIHLARLALKRGDESAAKREHARVRSQPATSLRVDLELIDIAVIVAIADEDDDAAGDAIERMLALAKTHGIEDARWQAYLLSGAWHRARGRSALAVEAYRRADRMLGDDTLQVPILLGRQMFMSSPGHAAEALIGLLIDAGRIREASSVARSSVGRARAVVRLRARVGSRTGARILGQWRKRRGGFERPHYRHRRYGRAMPRGRWGMGHGTSRRCAGAVCRKRGRPRVLGASRRVCL